MKNPLKQIANRLKTTDQKIDEIYDQIVNSDNFLDILSSINMAFSFYNSFLNRSAIRNDDIMKELNKQDKEYFEQILQLLKDIKENHDDDKR
jgi:hypothetical protein